ncbi:MAG TPA: ATP-dependent DNA helicase [Acetobacteraceae bacterium]|nr:ATP-dependent DNA helicase [Acetobacteraceae bacterium]
MPDAPAVVAGHGRAALLTPDGEMLSLSGEEADSRLRGLPPPLLVHAPLTWRRLGLRPMPCYDLLELFAFVLPARGAAPTPRGLAIALDRDPPAPDPAAEAALLSDLAALLLRRLAEGRGLPLNRGAAGLAARMGRAGWGWAPFVMDALGEPDAAASREAMKIWKRLPEWEETAPPPPPAAHSVTEAEARGRLAAILGSDAEQRPGQADYAGAAAAAFAPREQRGDPTLVLAEAATGTGKTLGYIAPASLWAERNRGAVWISTFTRHLQRQIEAELARLFPDAAERRRRVVLRKGRENYLCLLNLEDAAARGAPAETVPLALVARWALASADGDIQGGDLPGWMSELFGAPTILSLADRRGECIHAACPHWRRCFVEHTIRRARRAELVIANHALVMSQAAWGGLDDATVPTRYVFDEGHHLFGAADNAFACVLSGVETAELRRWLLGAEGGRSRSRGLRRRIEDLVAGRPELQPMLEAALQAARALPAPGWSSRLVEDVPELAGLDAGQPNPTEAFLRLIRRQILARTAEEPPAQGSLECDLYPAAAELREAAQRLGRALARIAEPLCLLSNRLMARLEEETEEIDAATRLRIEAMCNAIARRAVAPLSVWQAMLRAVADPPREPGERPEHILLLRLDRRDGVDRDAGLHRHWLDPTVPFVATLAALAHGLLVTSATLRDGAEADMEAAWLAAEARVGAQHLPSPAIRASVASPFDYAAQTRAFIVTDLPFGDIGALAAAYRDLFLAAGGGALGLFTAIHRLRAVHPRIAPALQARGISLYAQHVDAMDNATLVDIFRAEEESCLLGTDAMRDGVDVPGRALRLVVLEKVPWPRPDILHRERRIHLAMGDPKAYDDQTARLRLRQSFGRLIRRGTDRGAFVLLDRQTPSRLLSALPAGVVVRRVGLSQAIAQVRDFLEHSPPPPAGW